MKTQPASTARTAAIDDRSPARASGNNGRAEGRSRRSPYLHSGGNHARLDPQNRDVPREIERFVDFYTRVLRFELEEDRRSETDAYVAVRRGTTKIGANAAWQEVDPRARAVPQGIEVVFEVADLLGEREAIISAGWSLAADITEQSWGLQDFRLFDPDGYYLRFTTPPPNEV